MNKSMFEKAINISVKRSKNKNYNITEVAKILGIKYKDESELCNKINKYLEEKKKTSTSLTYFLNFFAKSDTKYCSLLIDALYELFNPSNVTESSLPYKRYKKLIQERQDGTITEGNNHLLERMLYLKLCRCIKQIYIKNIINQEFFNKSPLKYNKYAVCTSSIYNKRGFKAPASAVKNCRNTYSWYKTNNYD